MAAATTSRAEIVIRAAKPRPEHVRAQVFRRLTQSFHNDESGLCFAVVESVHIDEDAATASLTSSSSSLTSSSSSSSSSAAAAFTGHVRFFRMKARLLRSDKLDPRFPGTRRSDELFVRSTQRAQGLRGIECGPARIVDTLVWDAPAHNPRHVLAVPAVGAVLCGTLRQPVSPLSSSGSTATASTEAEHGRAFKRRNPELVQWVAGAGARAALELARILAFGTRLPRDVLETKLVQASMVHPSSSTTSSTTSSPTMHPHTRDLVVLAHVVAFNDLRELAAMDPAQLRLWVDMAVARFRDHELEADLVRVLGHPLAPIAPLMSSSSTSSSTWPRRGGGGGRRGPAGPSGPSGLFGSASDFSSFASSAADFDDDDKDDDLFAAERHNRDGNRHRPRRRTSPIAAVTAPPLMDPSTLHDPYAAMFATVSPPLTSAYVPPPGAYTSSTYASGGGAVPYSPTAAAASPPYEVYSPTRELSRPTSPAYCPSSP